VAVPWGSDGRLTSCWDFDALLVEEYGEPSVSEDPKFSRLLPTLSLTHAQIGRPLAQLVLQYTRLMGKLRQRGLLVTQPDN